MLFCPHCQQQVELRNLPHPSLFADFRVCPGCKGKFTPDAATKKRQAVLLVVAVASLAFTSLWYFSSPVWLIPALITYVIMGLLIYHGNRRIYLVPFNSGADESKTDNQGTGH